MKIQKLEKRETNYYRRNEYVIHLSNFKKALNHELLFSKLDWVMKFNPKPWLKPYIYMNAELGKDAKMIFRNIFSS